MKIETGKCYKTRDGRKVGPMSYCDDTDYDTNERLLSGVVGGAERLYRIKTGSHLFGNEELDIVSEWSEGPIRTVTRREIVPGAYGRVDVSGTYKGDRVTLDWTGSGSIHTAVPIVGLSASELREAAHLFYQLAEVLEENK